MGWAVTTWCRNNYGSSDWLRGCKGSWSCGSSILGNDLADNVDTNIEGYRIPFLRENRETGGWEIVTSHLSSSPWPSGPGYYNATFFGRVAKIFVPGAFSARIFSAGEYLIKEANRVTREADSRLVVVSIPSKNMLMKYHMQFLKRELADSSTFDVDYPDRQLAGICHRLGVHFIVGKEHLTSGHYRRSESHWNEKGNKRVSRLLGEIYSQSRFAESVVPARNARKIMPEIRAEA